MIPERIIFVSRGITVFVKLSSNKFHGNSSSGVAVMHVPRRTDGRTGMMKALGAFATYANSRLNSFKVAATRWDFFVRVLDIRFPAAFTG